MTWDPETHQRVGAWLEEGRTSLPDHVLDAVLQETRKRPQRPPRRPAWRFASMIRFGGQTIVTATLIVAIMAALNARSLLPAAGPVEDASPSTLPAAVPDGTLLPGRYFWPWSGGEIAFSVGEGWVGDASGGLFKARDTPAEYGFGPNLPGTPEEITHVYADACLSEGRLEPVGPSGEELLGALQDQAGIAAVATPITVGQAQGWRLEVEQARGLDRSTCRYGAEGPLQIWADPAEEDFFALAPGYRGLVYILDLDGERLVFAGALGPEAADGAAREMDAIVGSLDFPLMPADLKDRIPAELARDCTFVEPTRPGELARAECVVPVDLDRLEVSLFKDVGALRTAMAPFDLEASDQGAVGDCSRGPSSVRWEEGQVGGDLVCLEGPLSLTRLAWTDERRMTLTVADLNLPFGTAYRWWIHAGRGHDAAASPSPGDG